MNELIGPIYYVFASDSDLEWAEHAEANTFHCFEQLMSEMKDNFIKTLDKSNCGIEIAMKNFYDRLQAHDSQLYNRLALTRNIKPQFYAFRWILLLLSQEFSLPDLITIWDALLSTKDRLDTVQHMCLAMLDFIRDDLMNGDFSNNVRLLQNYPNIDIAQLICHSHELRNAALIREQQQNSLHSARSNSSSDASETSLNMSTSSRAGRLFAMISLSITGTATIRINSATQTEPCPEYRVSSGESSEQVAFQTYTGYIQCRLEEFATFIYESETITSDKIYIGGIPWMIKICSKRVNNASNVIGFYTKCGYDFGKDDDGLNNITANIEMVMKSSNDSSKSNFSRKFNETFTKSHSEWGYSEFRTIEEGFVQSNKTCIFESRITVVRPKQKLSPEKCRRKVQELMTVAKMQAERGILDKAIEANEIAFKLCFEEKDGDIMKDLEKQRDELIEMKLKQSIERLQKDEDASKCAAVPLKSACKHIGVLKKPPKKKNNNQRPKIKLAAPSKPKETRTIGTNTDDTYGPQKPSPELDANENLRYQKLDVLPQQEAEKVHLMIGLILPFIQDTIPERLFFARLQSAEHVFYELMAMSGCKPKYKNTEFDNIIHYDSFRESLIEMNICNEQSPPNDILRVLFSAVFPDYPKFMKEINVYILNMAIDNRKMLEQVHMLCDSVINVYQIIKEKSKKSLESKVNADLDKHDLRALYYEKMNPSKLQSGPKKIITLFSAHALKLKIYFRKLGTAKRDFLNCYIQRRKATIEKNKNVTKSFEERYERLSVRHAVLAAQYNTQHSILKSHKEKLTALCSLQKKLQEIQKHYGEKMGILNKMAKDLENSQMQVKKCEELLFRLKKDREEVVKIGKQKLKEENAKRQQMKEKVESLKLKLYKYDVELKKALAVESSTPSLSLEKAKAQSISLRLLETKRSVAIEKLDHIDLLLEKDERYLKAELPQKIYECVVQRFKKNLLMKRAIQNILKCIDDEMDSVQHGYPVDFSRINIPTIFVDEFGEI